MFNLEDLVLRFPRFYRIAASLASLMVLNSSPLDATYISFNIPSAATPYDSVFSTH